LPNGVVTEYVYDNLLRVDKITHWQDDTKASKHAEFAYTVGSAGKRLAVSELIDGATADWTYEYDKLDRLDQAVRATLVASVTTTYTYDIVGNRLSKDDGTTATMYTYNALDQVLTEVAGANTTNYSYDDNGSLKTKDDSTNITNYIYDS